MTEETTTTTEETTTAGPSLSLQDLASVIQIIDLCSSRGAFQGTEMEAVGALRGRFQAFVSANVPTEEPVQNPQETTEADE